MNDFLILLFGLLISHLIADFYLQPKSWVRDKLRLKWRSQKLLAHAIIHGLIATFVLILMTSDLISSLLSALLITLSHWLIDLIKIKLGSQLRYFLLDQSAHFIMLILIAYCDTQVSFHDMMMELKNSISLTHLALLSAYLFLLKPTSIIIGSILKKYTYPVTTNQQAHNQSTPQGLTAGGEIIGYLERALILTFMIQGELTVIGFILAAKSILRFGDLSKEKDRHLTEYVLLGSLLSVSITAFVGILLNKF